MQKKQPKTSISSLSMDWTDVVALALGFITLTFGLGGYGLYEPHEGHFSGVAREMLLRGDWITPTLNGAPYLNKPPLLYWLIATSTAGFGFTEYAARLPLAITGWVGALIAWQWARELWNPVAGRAAALMLCVACGWFMFTHQILIDVLLSTLLLAVYFCIWKALWKGGWVYLYALYILLGLCVLTKGPFALVFPLIGGLAIAYHRRSLAIFQQLRVALGVLITLLVTLPWVVAVERANSGFLNYFLLNENIKRIADTRWPPDYEVSKVSALGYIAITTIWCLPWSLVLPQTLYSAWKDWKQVDKMRSKSVEGEEETQAYRKISNSKSEGVLLLIVATSLPVLLFLPLSSRLVYYSVPAIAPFTLLCAGWWSSCHDKSQQKARIAAGFSFCLLGLGLCIASIWAPNVIKGLPELANAPDMSLIVRAIALFIGSSCLMGGIWMLLLRPNLALMAIFIGFVSTYVTITHGFALFQDFRSSKTLIEAANPRLGLTTLWTFEGSRELGAAGAMSYYLDRQGNHNLSEQERVPNHRTQKQTEAGTHRGIQGRGDAERGRRGERIQTGTEPTPEFEPLKSKISVGVSNPWDLRPRVPASPRLRVFFDEQENQRNLPPGWAHGKHNTAYRIVLVLTDGGPNRHPPSFPGSQPRYAITKKELQEYWDSPRPVVFVTDFMRKPDSLRSPNEPPDPPDLNLPHNSGQPLLVVGPRKLYGNPTARALWFKQP